MKTARNDAFLAQTKRQMNAKIYREVLRIANAEGRLAAATYLARFSRPELRTAQIAEALHLDGCEEWGTAEYRAAAKADFEAGRMTAADLATARRLGLFCDGSCERECNACAADRRNSPMGGRRA
jgi:hypothetical protein